MSPSPLEKLHDFVQPAPPSWMPHTIGWYILFALLALAAVVQLFKWIRAWRRNRYRRAALRELPLTPVADLSGLLKRTALVAWPRGEVAALTGEPWLRFLNESTDRQLFNVPPSEEIEALAICEETPNASDEQSLRRATEQWIRRHRVRA